MITNTLAQQLRIQPQVPGSGSPVPPITIDGPLQGINTIGDVINKLMVFLMPIAALILFFVLVWGGYDFLLSRGDAEKVKSARAKITAGIIGFVLLLASYILVKLIATIFGIGEGIL